MKNANNRQEIIDQIREDGGASVFWITANQRRAAIVTDLEESGAIVRKRRNKLDRYPWCVFEVVEK